MPFDAQSSTGSARSPTGETGWSRVRRLCSVALVGASLVAGGSTPALARGAAVRGGRGAAAAHSSGRAVSTPTGGAAAAHSSRAVSTPRGEAASVTSGRAVSTPYGGAAVVHQGRAVSTPRGTAYVGRTAAVRTGPRPYAHAPYAYGGRHYYAYRPYAYHRYTPYYWGPGFYPFGAIVPTVTATAIVVSVANSQYHYANGIWYLPSGSQYQVVEAPVDATVTTLPSGAVAVGEDEFYYAGAYYKKTASGYVVVAPRAGTVVDQLPPGGEEVTMGDRKYVKFGETYYQPIEQDGQPKYEVVEVK
jgi:hypothetical protein